MKTNGITLPKYKLVSDSEFPKAFSDKSKPRIAVGDRLAVYIGDQRHTLKLSSVRGDGVLFFDAKDNCGHMTYMAHPKQCRRLKVKAKQTEQAVSV